MARKINWGVIGSCGIALRRTIPEGIVPAANADLVAVFDTNLAKNAETAKRFGARACGSVEELLAAGVDAVYVATPVFVHCEQATQCVKAGKHVLCEKPWTMDVPSARGLVELAKQHGVQLGVGLMIRLQSQHQEALKLISSGKLGKPVYARAQLSCWYPPMEGAWRQEPSQGGGGSLADMGVHCMDLLEMFFGPAVAVSCRIGNIVHPYRSEDGAAVILEFENGALATVDAFFCIPDEGSKNVLELYGSEGSILAKGTIGQGPQGEMTLFLRAGTGYNAQQQRDASQGVAITPAPVNTYQAEIEEFSQAILDGRESALGGGLGLRGQRVLEACYESARSGRSIRIEK